MDEREALTRIDASALDGLLHPTFDPREQVRILARGVPASPGAAKGEVVFTVDEVSAAAAQGREVIFARRFADAGDVAGFAEAKGILTSEGGVTSHAAMVARGMGRPAVVGAGELEIDPQQRAIRCGDIVIAADQRIAIDGGTGVVTLDDVPLVAAQGSSHLQRVLEWADSIRTLGVRVNADVPRDAEQGLELGADGIGVCRTEHMFMRADRQPLMRAMIMARTLAERDAVLAELLPAQQRDFEGLFEAMGDLPVTIRLLDPPLHEFLPNQVALVQRVQVAREHDSAERVALERELDVVLDLAEVNPMLGTRGCRLGILHPEIYEMQVEAIMRAAHAVGERVGRQPRPEVMIPLVAYEQELAILRALVNTVAARHGMREGTDYTVGTMIELPRACFAAGRLAAHAGFFSFGTNDLTQTALGFSRDDVEADFVSTYLEQNVFERSPFETIDVFSVGALVKLAAERGREHRPEILLGVCGEHGGDPDSIRFFHSIGLDYVSCSLYRLPVARVAAAQARIAELAKGSLGQSSPS
jgi:pyruvate,orthophosphate dikinase